MKPPRLAARLLEWSLPRYDREVVLGDCAEEYSAIAASRGRAMRVDPLVTLRAER